MTRLFLGFPVRVLASTIPYFGLACPNLWLSVSFHRPPPWLHHLPPHPLFALASSHLCLLRLSPTDRPSCLPTGIRLWNRQACVQRTSASIKGDDRCVTSNVVIDHLDNRDDGMTRRVVVAAAVGHNATTRGGTNTPLPTVRRLKIPPKLAACRCAVACGPNSFIVYWHPT